jgi:hypothetical protein
VTPDQDEFRRRAIRAALMVAGIAVVIGLVIGGITAGVINMTGLVPEAPASPTTLATAGNEDDDELPTPSLLPTNAPAPSATESPSPAKTSAKTSGVADKASPSPSRRPHKQRKSGPPSDDLTLRVSDSSVSAYDEVTLTGSYPGANGTTLQVQRLEGGSWTSFPTTATVDGGRFSTYVASGQHGRNEFRVVDPDTGEASNVVAFTVS